jgi:DNA (cytosine-5)-methyltransferase 1
MQISSKQQRGIAIDSGSFSEVYEFSGNDVLRKVVMPDRNVITRLSIDSRIPEGEDARSAFDYSYLRLKNKPEVSALSPIYAVDLFSGCGCLTLGALEACRAIGQGFVPLLAIDKDKDAMEVYKENFSPLKTFTGDISTLVNGILGSEPTFNEKLLKQEYLDNKTPFLLLAGPPCQGYSSLNNFHRQSDDRNILYERVARFIELTSPENVLIENVPTVIYSKDKVVQRTIQLLSEKHYFLDSGVVNLADIGVPQVRKRHVLLASKRKRVSIVNTINSHHVMSKRSFKWAAVDLENELPMGILNSPTKHSPDNIKRMTYLHENDVYILPNDMRPKCHQKPHGYKSMYGRIKMDIPTQTITSGFTSPGQGRFTHPTKIRTITPHEAARLQLIPDFFNFSKASSRRSLSLMIGNSVPMKLSYILCLESLI